MAFKPQDVAQELVISPSTLRLWSSRFADLLSDQARKVSPDGTGAMAQRRYAESDLSLLLRAKELLGQGLTYEEARIRLGGIPQAAQQQSQTPFHAQQQPPFHAQPQIQPQPQTQSQSLPQPTFPDPYRSQRVEAEYSPPVMADPPVTTPSIMPPQTNLNTPRETTDQKDRAIATLTQSLTSMEAYLHTLIEEMRELRVRERQLRREVDRLRLDLQTAEERKQPWWQRLLAPAPSAHVSGSSRKRSR
jgi:DNA-binding transcriptional MerR regulator